jgi:hypothetical protein
MEQVRPGPRDFVEHLPSGSILGDFDMPTGYTSKVADGTLTDFTEYAKKCASAFIGGKLEKDKKYVAEDYHETEMQKARQELDEFLRLSDEGKYQMYLSEQ